MSTIATLTKEPKFSKNIQYHPSPTNTKTINVDKYTDSENSKKYGEESKA